MRQVVTDRGARPLFLIDLAVPRDIEPGVENLENVYVYNIDSLQAAVEEALVDRERELPRVREICDEAAREFWAWAASLDLMPTMLQLREKAEAVRQQEFERALVHMGNLSSKQQKHLHLLTKRIVQALIGEPLGRLRTKACGGNGIAYLSVLRELFDLAEGDADALAADGQAPEGEE
jgi:glutamyl-tRNA reductase